VTVTKSKPPGTGVGFTNTDNLQEGSTIGPGKTRTLHVQFQPQQAGPATDHWTINADGDQGVLTLELTGTGVGASGGDPSKGCSSTGAGAALWPLLGLIPLALRRRRPS
jgi:MYXO-CTERM domain-containing protein